MVTKQGNISADQLIVKAEKINEVRKKGRLNLLSPNTLLNGQNKLQTTLKAKEEEWEKLLLIHKILKAPSSVTLSTCKYLDITGNYICYLSHKLQLTAPLNFYL